MRNRLFIWPIVSFYSVRDGAILWSGALITGIICLAHLRAKHRWAAGEKRLIWAVGLTMVLLSVAWADLLLIFAYSGMELLVRSTRYRNTLVPFLAFVLVTGLAWRLKDTKWASSIRRIPTWPTVICGAAAMWLVLITTLWSFGPRHQLPFSRAGLQKHLKIIRLSDQALFFSRHPLAGDVIQILDTNREGFSLVDWMPLLLFTDAPVKNPWLNPGLFPLLDARKPFRSLDRPRGR